MFVRILLTLMSEPLFPQKKWGVVSICRRKIQVSRYPLCEDKIDSLRMFHGVQNIE